MFFCCICFFVCFLFWYWVWCWRFLFCVGINFCVMLWCWWWMLFRWRFSCTGFLSIVCRVDVVIWWNGVWRCVVFNKSNYCKFCMCILCLNCEVCKVSMELVFCFILMVILTGCKFFRFYSFSRWRNYCFFWFWFEVLWVKVWIFFLCWCVLCWVVCWGVLIWVCIGFFWRRWRARGF